MYLDGAGGTKSANEDAFVPLAHRAGLGEPRANARVAGIEVDFSWPGRPLVVEIDGGGHLLKPVRRDDDWRDDWLRGAGYTVLRFTRLRGRAAARARHRGAASGTGSGRRVAVVAAASPTCSRRAPPTPIRTSRGPTSCRRSPCPSAARAGLDHRRERLVSANYCIAAGIVSVGTNAEPRNGSRNSGIGRLLAASRFLRDPERDGQPGQRERHQREQAERARASRAAGGRPEPERQRDADTIAMLAIVWIRLPRTWPVSTDRGRSPSCGSG